jgi:hypothetical protein
MANVIPAIVKKTCCQMYVEGKSSREIYNEYFTQNTDSSASYGSFRAMLARWTKKNYPDEITLERGTYDGFIAHDATVQVSKSGEIVQAWIKQKATDIDTEEFLEAIRGSVEPALYEMRERVDTDRMLEIPLFDMHWGIAFMDHYTPVLNELLNLIASRNWDRIVIPFGQDFFHNDSVVNGQTTKGTVIDKVDMVRAVRESKTFMYMLIDTAIKHANEVKVVYSPGNHDRSIAWMFVQVLLERYGPTIVDDALEYRKVFTYGKNAIMVTHGDSKRATPKNLAHIFAISFPEQFANADVREVHAGHLHCEGEADIFGVMVRRLSTGGKIDDWSNREDFVGAHRRFMVFEWDHNKLNSIHYI